MKTSIYDRMVLYKQYLGSQILLDTIGRFHCECGPAIIDASGDKFWFKHGKLHRLDGPASEFADGFKEWFIEDKHIPVASQSEFERYLKLKGFW
jgi:hypothetical protein